MNHPRIPATSLRRLLLLLAIGPFLAWSGLGHAELPPLLPRQALLSDAVNDPPQVSPDGNRLAWVSAANGLPNVWLRSVTTNDARLLSLDPRGSIRHVTWQRDSQAVLYLQETDGTGIQHLMQAHVGTGILRDLTPFTGVQGALVATSDRFPGQILAALNLVNRRRPDIFRIDVRTGALSLEAEGAADIGVWYADDHLGLRLAQMTLPDGTPAFGTRADARSMWRPILRWDADDAVNRVVGFGPSGSNVWLISSVKATAPRLLDLNLATGSAATLASDPRYDVTSVLLHPVSNTIDAVQFYRARAQWMIINTNLLGDFEALRKYQDADIDVLSRDMADRFWTVSLTSDRAPVLYALYDRTTRTVTPLFSERPILAASTFAPVKPISLKARDGLPLEGYLTLPPGLEPKGLPTVLLVHGGPWSRVAWGFDPEAQWLANRGYAVVQINFRGSTGYGKPHLDAGDKQWGGAMLDDVVDARAWAVAQGTADEARIAIMGTGFGGHAVLSALCRYPKLFAAGVSLSAPPSLPTLLKSVPTNAVTLRGLLARRVGDPEKDAARLQDQSPLRRAAFITAPLLATLGGRDPQVDLKEMDQFVAAIRQEGRHVEYLFFPDDTTGLRDPANRLRHTAAVEAFLARHLGGRAAPPAASESVDAFRR